MQDNQTKLEKVKSQLAKHFTASKVRSVEGVIRLNVPSLEDRDLMKLASISIENNGDVNIRRSGTGLAVIVKI